MLNVAGPIDLACHLNGNYEAAPSLDFDLDVNCHALPHDSPHFLFPQTLRRFAPIPYQTQEFPG